MLEPLAFVLAVALVGPAHVVPDRAPHAVVSPARDGLRGVASWFAAPRGTAAAGPSLRRLLGAHWRGTVVTVTANGHSVRVQLTDWCACRGRIIDLGVDSFARLTDPSRGLVRVSVR